VTLPIKLFNLKSILLSIFNFIILLCKKGDYIFINIFDNSFGVMSMKLKFAIIFLAVLLLAGCSANINYDGNNNDTNNVEFTRLGQENTVGAGSSDEIRILSANTTVGYEEYASISIIGKPGETYTITSKYKWGGEDVSVFEKRTANRDGVATWVWKVRSNTTPGTYPIVITGGNQRIETSYTVLP